MSDILYFGDAKRERGFHHVHLLAKRLPDIKFKILMRYKFPDCEKDLQDMKDMGNINLILFATPRRIKEELKSTKLVLLPYVWMAMRPPLTLVEAMSLGKCVITSQMGGNEELITDGFDGRMVDFYYLESVIQVIRYLLKENSVREEMGRNAKETIAKLYSQDEYRKILNGY